jgi:hypothetical protein
MRCALGIVPLFLFASVCFAVQPDRISGTIDSSRSVLLTGSVHTKAQPQFDQGLVEPSFQLPYITMIMQPSAKQQADLQQLLKQQQDPASPNHRKWLTPEQYADRFGVSQNDIEKLSVWLRSQGFSIVQAARGRNWIAFSGTAALVESAFHTQIHYFNLDGEQHFANATEISIPQALAGVVVGFGGLNDFSLRPMGIKEPGPVDFFPLIGSSYNLGGSHFLAPDDIATIYDITPLYSSNINGTGMKMVVVGQVDVSASLSDIDDFRAAFNLSKNDPQQTIVPGSPNPGTNSGDMIESKLDLEWAGAVARDATILFITAATSANGVSGAAQYAIDQDLAPVISMSYGGCESQNVTFIPGNEVEQQKASGEGITFLASSGDTGAAGCDANNASVATGGLAVNYPASSPEVTGVGGNEFNEGSGNYWNTSNGTNGGSAISYIPETAWNDTSINGTLAASGGGASSCGQTSGSTCLKGFAKPTWQAGTGVPNDGVRDVPDVSMTASADHDGYIICQLGTCGGGVGSSPTIAGGTSASTPVFAGIVVLLNQFLASKGLGNINPTLYQLAQNPSNGVFHDVTTGNNIVPCSMGSPNCPTSGTLQYGYNAGVGYDLATGLGSVDAHALAVNFSGSATTTTLTSSSNPATSGITVTFTATVTTTGSNAPTGTVNFNDGATTIGTGTISAGKATFSSSTLGDGGHSLTAVYAGDSKNAPSTSAALIETIEGTGTSSTTTTAMAGQGAVAYGTNTSFTATVTTTNSTVPGATVTFEDGGVPLGFVALTAATANSGTATFTTSALTAGAHSITGLYSGDTKNNQTSTSSAVSQTINQAATTTTLAAISSPVNAGASVTLSATVSYAAGNPPNGETVTFKDNTSGKTLGTGKLAGGTASFSSTSIAGGSYAVVASYPGDTNLTASASSPAQTLNVQDFTVSANPTTVSIGSPGQSGSTTLTITPLGGFSQTLNFNCNGLPSEATCTFASAGTNSEKVTIATAAASGWKRPFGRGSSIFYAMLLPGVMGLVLPARKRPLRSLLSLLVVLAVLMLWMPACGGGGGSSNSNPGTPTGSSNVTITASTAGTGALVSHAVTVTLSVQ